MRERKYVKFRVDMYEDTKFKIIDRMPKRDLIHYVWSRIVVLAGKVNQEGDLYMSRSTPYTLETLAIEFNRDIDEIKDAMNVLIELEMIEYKEDKTYRVRNFAKHQNIKIKEDKTKEIGNVSKNDENNIQKDESENKIENEIEESFSEISSSDQKKTNSNDVANYDVVQPEENIITKLEDVNKKYNPSNINLDKNNCDITQHNNSAVICEMKKNRQRNKKTDKKKNKEEIIETYEDISDSTIGKTKDDFICWISEGEISLEEGEHKIAEWVF